MDHLPPFRPDIPANPHLHAEGSPGDAAVHELGGGALAGVGVDQPESDTWNEFVGGHPELVDLSSKTSEKIQSKIDALERAAEWIQATDIGAADALREKVRKLLMEAAEPLAVKITTLKAELKDLERGDTKLLAIKDQISLLESQYLHLVAYNPYHSGTTPYTRALLREAQDDDATRD